MYDEIDYKYEAKQLRKFSGSMSTFAFVVTFVCWFFEFYTAWILAAVALLFFLGSTIAAHIIASITPYKTFKGK